MNQREQQIDDCVRVTFQRRYQSQAKAELRVTRNAIQRRLAYGYGILRSSTVDSEIQEIRRRWKVLYASCT